MIVVFPHRTEAQVSDTSHLRIFTFEDLNLSNGGDKRSVTSTNRLTENAEDMAQEVIIIEGDDIRKFGYSTLVDVLKSIPGFRVSQPGNALEGETFLMRGLVGNDHAKILINGIPIKPEAVRGMPIASQLPIRHAERIEIVLGPSSSSYGTDAMAGVINIVLPEVDRPVFAWADVNLMSPKTTEFNLTLGGKVGKGKNILNYEIFATSNQASDINVLIPDDSIRVTVNDDLDASQWQFLAGNDSVPEIDDLKRESRLLGTYLKFRWFELTAMNMYRNEHSGFGSNPLVQSYNAPDLTFGENINSFSLKYKDEREKRFMNSFSLSALTYRTLPNSSYFGLAHYLSNGRNYMYGRSIDFNGEYVSVLKIGSQMRLAIGATGEYSISHPFTDYMLRPWKDESLTFDLRPEQIISETGAHQSAWIDSASSLATTQFMERYTRYSVGGFVHFSYISRNRKVFVELGTRADYNSFKEIVFTPKAGLVYRPMPRVKLRMYYGTGYRAPRSYYIYNNYTQNFLAYDINGEGLERRKAELKSEALQGGELGAEWKATDYLKFTGCYYVHYIQNKILRKIFLPPSNPDDLKPTDQIGFGYSNEEAYSLLHAALFTAEFRKEFRELTLDFEVGYQFSKGSEFVQTLVNDEVERIESSGYRFVPDYMVHANFEFSLYEFTLSLRNSLIGEYVSDIFLVNKRVEYTTSEKTFYNLDILLHKQIFRQLSVFGGVYNVLNSVQSGIPNVNLSSTWSFNPQNGRIFKFGITFKLN